MEDREAYKEKMAAQLEEWSDQIGVLETRVKKANAEVRLRRAEEMHELRVTRNQAAEKMKELDEASAEAWGHVSKRTAKVIENLKSGVSVAHSRFR